MKILVRFTILDEKGNKLFPDRKQEISGKLEKIGHKPNKFSEGDFPGNSNASVAFLAEIDNPYNASEKAKEIENAIEPTLNSNGILIQRYEIIMGSESPI